jgi:Holliday junction resolvasome RuvABC DNA-binding subunit
MVPTPFKKVVVRPTPEKLIGFRTLEEQLAAMDLLINCSKSGTKTYLKMLDKESTVVVQNFANPEPPTSEALWIGEE